MTGLNVEVNVSFQPFSFHFISYSLFKVEYAGTTFSYTGHQNCTELEILTVVIA